VVIDGSSPPRHSATEPQVKEKAIHEITRSLTK
jgi:hypothetical protein